MQSRGGGPLMGWVQGGFCLRGPGCLHLAPDASSCVLQHSAVTPRVQLFVEHRYIDKGSLIRTEHRFRAAVHEMGGPEGEIGF